MVIYYPSFEMATNVVSGSRLSVPPSIGCDIVGVSEQGTNIYGKGANLRLKDALMCIFGAGWKTLMSKGR